MDMSDAPNAADTKSRREKEDDFSTAPSTTSFLSSIACSLITKIQKQTGVASVLRFGSTDGRPCPVRWLLLSACPVAIDRAFKRTIAMAVPGLVKRN
ncbi:hypothetical protein [Dechloromonas sp. TW-R-39-2]|uniref:hypothetical protein n=1 Tax=Dechloromonas sp. TW-R-39-2 TaxID=2654218 RepID=UPI00193D8C86|nr:hypothetical protein [Dechloromonas sp. TW-R-39-2]